MTENVALSDATPNAFEVAGVTLLADLSGALFWEEQKLLVVSDLHLEKGSSFAARGVLLPPYDTAATLSRLAAVIARHDPRMVIALGDSFHDSAAWCSPADRDAITAAGAARLDLDIGQSRSGIAVGFGGMVAEVAIGRIAFRHEPTRLRRNRRHRIKSPCRRAGAPSTALLCHRRRPRRDAGLRRLYRRLEHPGCRVRKDLRHPRLHGACARRRQTAHHRRLAMLLML
jgi:hypothetical protein